MLVTGANGFIGSALVAALRAREPGIVRAAVRRLPGNISIQPNTAAVGDLGGDTDWSVALEGIDAVVHTAARVHMMNDRPGDRLEAYRRINVDSTLNLARQAVGAGARRFIFLSSIKVNGELTPLGRPFTAADPAMPKDEYAVSKHEAEDGLRQLGRDTGLEVVIIRPVLVYGPGVKANFLSMMRWIDRGIPLPFGAIRNARSLVALDNLVDLVTRCLYHPAAQNRTFLVSDGEDLSTPDLLRRTGAAMGRRTRLIPVPESALQWMAAVIGKADKAEKLWGSLQVDIGETRRLLGWRPPLSVDDALSQTARYFLDTERSNRQTAKD